MKWFNFHIYKWKIIHKEIFDSGNEFRHSQCIKCLKDKVKISHGFICPYCDYTATNLGGSPTNSISKTVT